MTLPLFPPPRPVDPPHRCHARDCMTAVRPELLMCLRHWRMIPKFIQRAVWQHYREGQCDDKQVTDRWMQAADAAIGFVARAEGRPVREVELEALRALGAEG